MLQFYVNGIMLTVLAVLVSTSVSIALEKEKITRCWAVDNLLSQDLGRNYYVNYGE